jgi:hypothetical protein
MVQAQQEFALVQYQQTIQTAFREFRLAGQYRKVRKFARNRSCWCNSEIDHDWLISVIRAGWNVA